MFPSGTRHSQNLKGGVLLIARLANVPIVPAVYQGPTTLKGLLKRQKVTIAFGDPIELNSRKKLTEDEQQVILEKMTNSFKKIDAQINPDYVYIDESKIN